MATTAQAAESASESRPEVQPTGQELAVRKASEDEGAPTQQKSYAQDNYLPDAYFNEQLFQADNTGTRKYRNLMRGLKNIITTRYYPSENPDLMPRQLAKYYEELNGDYNQLFLKTPNPSISFIYKSLGCWYSLQPIPDAQKVDEPEVPALKTEGWIMWSTIQMLLGPDEHASFLMEAVKRWDVIDPDTGKIFPKVLPRNSLPLTPDKRMSDWYEGVSERLDREAEEEARLRERQQQAMSKHADTKRISIRTDDDTASIDSRGPALAYFRNPLYRLDGRPSIVRRTSARPPLSPRHSLVDKGKTAAATVGNVLRNVTSLHLWDGNANNRRRRSVPDNRYHHPSEPAPQDVPYDDRLPGPGQSSPRTRHGHNRAGSSPSADDRGSAHSSQARLRPRDDREPALRHSRSHDPTPSQRDYGDYFQQGETAPTQDDMPPAIGPSFAPSPSLPFAATVARQQPPDNRGPRRAPSTRGDDRAYSPVDRRPRFDEPGPDGPSRRRSRSRYDDRLPYDDRARPNERPPYDERSKQDGRPPYDERSRQDGRPPYDDRSGRPPYDDRPRPDGRDPRARHGSRPPYDDRPRYDDRPPPGDRPRHDGRPPPGDRSRYDDRPFPGDRPRRDDRPPPNDRMRYDDGPPPGDRGRYDEGPPPGDRTRYDDAPPPVDERPRYDERPPYDERPRFDDRPGPDERHRHHRPPYDERRDADDRPRDDDRGPEERRRYDDQRDRYESPDPRRSSGGYQRSASRRSRGSDMDSGFSGLEDQDRRSSRKQTRFAGEPISGVDGRRYVDGSPWQAPG